MNDNMALLDKIMDLEDAAGLALNLLLQYEETYGREEVLSETIGILKHALNDEIV